MLARNSRGLLVSLLSPAPTASEIENRPQSRDHGDRSQDACMEGGARTKHEERIENEVSIKEEARIEHEERIQMEASLKEEERTKDEKKIQNPSDVALESAEYDEKLRLRGVIDLRYYYNMTRDANSLSTGRNTNSTEPGLAGQASTEDIIREWLNLNQSQIVDFHPYSEDAGTGESYDYTDHCCATRSSSMEVLLGTELVRAAPEKKRRLSTPSPPSPPEYPCLYPSCGHISSRAHDLKRHYTVHFPLAIDELLDCKYEWCGRTGAHGFKREDHRKEHYRRVHRKEN